MERDVYHVQYRLQLLCGGEWLDNNTPINDQNLNDYLKLCSRDDRRRVVRQTTRVEFSEEVISNGPITAPPSPAAAVAAAGPGAEVYPRTPAGFINNCALNVGFPESECQMCNGNCPDREKFRLTDPYLLAASEASGRAGGEDQEGGGHE